MNILKNYTIILVQPLESLNVGMVARAMKNMGCLELIIVDPKDYKPEKALWTACHAVDVIEGIQIVSTLEKALETFTNVVGFCGVYKNREDDIKTLFQWVSKEKELEKELDTHNLQKNKTALVFGPEDTGLRDEHLYYCRELVTIPVAGDYASFNIAQAVLVTLFELQREFLMGLKIKAESTPGGGVGYEQSSESKSSIAVLATWKDYAQLDHTVDAALAAISFYNSGTTRQLPKMVKNMFRAVAVTRRQAQVLQGIFGRVVKVVVGG